jgi:ABC-type glycerol-3-phosphate transport system substrate-binding protein
MKAVNIPGGIRMKKLSKLLLLSFVVLCIGGFLYARGGQEEGSAEAAGGGAEEKVKLDFWWQDWPGGIKWTTAFIEKFEAKYPNIDINLVPVAFDELYAKFIPSIAQGNDPALLFGYSDWVIGKDVSKLFTPLTPDLMSKAEIEKYIYEPALVSITGPDGNYYGLPVGTGANAFGFAYHKDLFREAGIDADKIKSWDDLKAAAKKLTVYNDDGSIKRSGVLFSYTEAANTVLDMIQMQGARNKLFNKNTNTWNFNIPEAEKALETFKWFVDNKVYDPQAGDPFNAFPNKLGAMLLIGPWEVGGAMTDFPELEVAYLPMPSFPTANTDLVLGSIISYFNLTISKRLKGAEKEAAYTFINEIMTNPEEYYDIPFYASPPYWVGAVSNKEYVKILEGRSESEMNEFSYTALDATKNGLPAINTLDTVLSEPLVIRQTIYPEMENVFLGKKTIDQVLTYLSSFLTEQEKQAAE